MNIPILIPAYNPDKNLIKLANELIKLKVKDIIIVNDGSKEKCSHIFNELEKNKECHMLHHAVNLGKGRALKTGLNYFYLHFKKSPGVVTADADGQHKAEDIIKVADSLNNNPNKLILGARKFNKDMPKRSSIGNIITRYIFFLLVGKKISDTQSGLRGIGRKIIPQLLKLNGERYEYELNMLISTKTEHIEIKEEEITTIYLENNKASHFNPLLDSMRIYFLLFRFFLSSMLTSIVDLIFFTLIYKIFSNILISIIVARFFASILNFIVNKKIVFHNTSNISLSIIKYYLNVIVIGSLAYFSISFIAKYTSINVILIKIIVESVLFVVNFVIQRDIIFIKKKDVEQDE